MVQFLVFVLYTVVVIVSIATAEDDVVEVTTASSIRQLHAVEISSITEPPNPQDGVGLFSTKAIAEAACIGLHDIALGFSYSVSVIKKHGRLTTYTTSVVVTVFVFVKVVVPEHVVFV